jgi:drug/metabolite transporter (DMT)-like permease
VGSSSLPGAKAGCKYRGKVLGISHPFRRCNGAFWLFYYKALQLGEASKVVPIDKFSVVISMVLAFIILKEEASVKPVIGALLITAGTLVLIW